MSKEESMTVRTAGITFLDLLTIVFVVLKLCGKIDWSWWWVLSPLLIPTGLLVIAVVLAAILKPKL